jgi:multidrug efflux pump subunit AcrA (membrane-fusion protein)
MNTEKISSIGWQRNSWIGIVASGLVVVGTGVILYQRFALPEQLAITKPLTVSVISLTPVNSYNITRYYTGEVVATRRTDLGFERAGKVIEVLYDRGQIVEAGAIIARLDTQNLQAQLSQLEAQRLRALAQLQELQNGSRREVIASARSQVSDLENQLRLANTRSQRRESLYKEGAVSKEQFEEVAFNRDALSDRLAAAQSQLEEVQNGARIEQINAQAAAVAQIEASILDLEITIAKSNLTAPFRGVIGERNLDEGSVAQVGQAIVRLVESANPELEIGVPFSVAATLKVGSSQTVEIGDRTYTATVIAIKPETNLQTRTSTVVLKLQNSSQATNKSNNKTTNLAIPKSGEIARLKVSQTEQIQGFWLPTTALSRGERGLWSCFAIARDGDAYRVEKRDVEVLHTEGDRVLVRGTISANEEVVSSGTQRLVNGQTVTK